MNRAQAKTIVAVQIMSDLLGEADWQNYPEIGENDWQDIAESLHRYSTVLAPPLYEEAYALLAGLAEGVEA